MRNITIDVLTFNERLRIGKQGENLTREITFDCAAWLDTLSGGVLSIVHQRPTDSDAYPCGDYTVTDTSLTWSINETDLAFSGLGRCELRYTIGSRIAKSKTFYTEIITALNPLDTPPAAYEPYIDRVIDAARWEMDALSVGGTATETERLSVQIDKIVPVDPDDGYGIYFRFGIPKGADGKGVSNATASVDNNTGTPSVTVTTTDTEEGMDIDFSFHNLKGATGAAGQDGDSVGTVTASVDNNTGTPSVTVTTSGGSGSPVGIDLAFHNLKGQSFDTSFLPSDTASGSPATFPDGAKNVTVDELVTTIVPQQDLHGYDKPWAAGAGKNKTNITNNTDAQYMNVTTYKADEVEATNIWSGSKFAAAFLFNAVSGTSYTFSVSECTLDGVNANAQLYLYSDKLWGTAITNMSIPSSTHRYTWQSTYTGQILAGFYVPSGKAINFKQFQIEEGSSATSYAPYTNICPISGRTQAQINHNGDTDTIAFGQTVYGGSLNVTTGVLTIDHAFLEFNGTEDWSNVGGSYPQAFQLLTGITTAVQVPSNQQDIVCNKYEWTGVSPGQGIRWANQASSGRLYVYDDRFTSDLSGFLADMVQNHLTLAYNITNPTTVQLTPVEVDTILGSNNIYSDCGEVSVKYRADIGLYIDKKLA